MRRELLTRHFQVEVTVALDRVSVSVEESGVSVAQGLTPATLYSLRLLGESESFFGREHGGIDAELMDTALP